MLYKSKIQKHPFECVIISLDLISENKYYCECLTIDFSYLLVAELEFRVTGGA